MLPYAHIAILIWLIPVCLFAFLAVFHKQAFLPRVRDWLATGAMGVCLGLSLYMFYHAWGGSALPKTGVSWQLEWFRMAPAEPVRMGVLVDNLTVIMLVVVTLVSFLVYLFSIGYMHGDPKYGRYFCGLLLFSASMVGLVLADNLFMLYIFWELVGLSSYVLIGHWFEKPSACQASMKAFITTRIGDVGMFIGIMIIYWQIGSFSYSDVFAAVGRGSLAGTWRTWAGIGLFLGAVGKSAQFPLHVWLPDAMEGPTPVSALIHAATMVAAGVYMVGRLFLLFDAPTFLVIAYTGAITAFVAATIALVQDDIKKVLAYSTVSQLGYMMLALGVGSYAAGLFHLTTHAFFKACLFLGSGSVIYAMHHEQRMSQYGGLYRKMKITALTFLFSCLSISGFPFITAGFYSKDLILGDTLAFFLRPGHSAHFLLPLFGFGTAFMTAFYMFRQYYLTFTGEPRNPERFHHAHESPWVMTLPLVILGALAIVGGGFKFGPINAEWFESMGRPPSLSWYSGEQITEGGTLQAAGEGEDGAAAEAAGEGRGDPLVHEAHQMAMYLSIVLALSGILVATLFYWRGFTQAPAAIAGAVKPLYTFLWNKWYFDELYWATVIAGTVAAFRISRWFDIYIIDFLVNLAGQLGKAAAWLIGLFDNRAIDGAVNGAGWLCSSTGGALGRLQTGRVRTYLLTLVVGVLLIAAICLAAF
ncbi:MAG: NADH-quinone oxidoreductase subunit L [Candidatus Sumerlaeota bacterium]|nr:NADH-quinone oxidoreductase subunit L [Candidatus Sumerlaeota bacterium]